MELPVAAFFFSFWFCFLTSCNGEEVCVTCFFKFIVNSHFPKMLTVHIHSGSTSAGSSWNNTLLFYSFGEVSVFWSFLEFCLLMGIHHQDLVLATFQPPLSLPTPHHKLGAGSILPIQLPPPPSMPSLYSFSSSLMNSSLLQTASAVQVNKHTGIHWAV